MHIAWLAAASVAVVLTTAPARAEVTIHTGHSTQTSNFGARGGGGLREAESSGGRHRHHHSRDGAFFAGWYDSDVGENRSWRPDSYNDWWHDRPDRAFPRWMSNNQDCQRLWWSGGGWRC
jgi:hypothetical protein